MKIRLHSQYDHFPNYRADRKEPAFELWNDGKIWEKKGEGSALMIEPRPLQEENYRWLETNYYKFKWIFTHDSRLLAICPNALPIVYWNQYELNDEPKTKDISMICGTKMMCPLHIERRRIAEKIQDDVDILGDWLGGDRVSIRDAYSPYKFAVVIENHVDDLWFTEKILNAFANKTVPIYFGARKITEMFDGNGIIQVDNLWDIPKTIKRILSAGVDFEYNIRRGAIAHNYNIVQEYRDFEDWFVTKYETLIEGEMQC